MVVGDREALLLCAATLRGHRVLQAALLDFMVLGGKATLPATDHAI